jgi:hypothetical protein
MYTPVVDAPAVELMPRIAIVLVAEVNTNPGVVRCRSATVSNAAFAGLYGRPAAWYSAA